MSRKTLSEIKRGETVNPAGFMVKVRIEDLERDVVSEGGIVVGGYAKDEVLGLTKQQLTRGAERGVVMAAGPLVGQCEGLDAYGVKVGNTVFFERYEGNYFEDTNTGESYIFIREDKITAFIDKGDK